MTNITITASGASEEELLAGARAAESVFQKAGLTPTECFSQYQARQRGEAHNEAAARCWETAQHEAFSACFDGWNLWPNTARLAVG